MSRPPADDRLTARPPARWLALGLAAPLAWLAWLTLSRAWAATAEYSHGPLVPAVAAYLLYRRRALLSEAPPGGHWWGLLPSLLAGAVGLAGKAAGSDSLTSVALLPGLAGLALLAGGWPALRWSWPGVALLLFLIPPPARVARAISGPLRTVAAQASGYALQTLGLPVILEEHTLLLEEHQLDLTEASGGLGLPLTFTALASAVAILSNRPPFDRILLALSAVPIIIAANVFRITVVALGYSAAGKGWGDVINNHLAGWLTAPVGLGLLWVELRLVDVILGPPRPREGKGPPAAAHLGSLLSPHDAPPLTSSLTSTEDHS